MSNRPFMTVQEVADELGVSVPRVYQLISSNDVPAVKVGGRIRVPRRAFAAWIEEKTELALAAVSQ